jgi:hypothetical protein
MGKNTKIGDLIVRTRRNSSSRAKIGIISRVNYASDYDNSVQYGNCVHINHRHYRMATKEEVEFYKFGYRNIDQIKKQIKTIDNFSII